MKDRAADILGVRLDRNGPVLFVESGNIHALRGARVAVKMSATGQEREATVCIGTGQMLAAAIENPTGRIVRLMADTPRQRVGRG